MTREKIIESSGNVFSDLGIADSEAHSLKAGLALKLADVIKASGLTQSAAARLIGLAQPDLSRILRGHLREVSSDRLIRALTRLNSDIEITVCQEGHQVGEPIHLHAVPA